MYENSPKGRNRKYPSVSEKISRSNWIVEVFKTNGPLAYMVGAAIILLAWRGLYFQRSHKGDYTFTTPPVISTNAEPPEKVVGQDAPPPRSVAP